MKSVNPFISIITPTFNRAKTIARAIDSILQQTYDNYEIIVVEDGSNDETKSILQRYSDKRLRIIYHEINKGVSAAKNTGLNNISGEWFTFLDSDDEMLPGALETMMKIPLEKDSTVTAITCNCVDTTTGNFSGKGLMNDQYIDFKTIIRNCSGEFWGLTKTELLLNDRFNERLAGYEDLLWFKINERAKRYYIHKALRLYHTEGNDRVTHIPPSIDKRSKDYEALSKETQYLESLKTYLPDRFARNCLIAIIYLTANKKRECARFYYDYLKKSKKYHMYKVISFFAYNMGALPLSKSIDFFKVAKKLSTNLGFK
jgi:glycosyltransferase involved in cell wall biosynthesis